MKNTPEQAGAIYGHWAATRPEEQSYLAGEMRVWLASQPAETVFAVWEAFYRELDRHGVEHDVLEARS